MYYFKLVSCCVKDADLFDEDPAMKTFVETSSILMDGIDEMIREGYFQDRSEAVNEALKEMLDRYKLSKLRAKERKVEQHNK